ncbi:ATP-binding protein, partial [Candidatus Parcubacteria bacterium]
MDRQGILDRIENERARSEIEVLIGKLKDGRIDEERFWSDYAELISHFRIEDPLASDLRKAIEDLIVTQLPPAVPLASPLEKTIANLPFPLAMVVSEYTKEQNTYIKLHRLCDAAEMFTRFSAVVMLMHLHKSGSGFSEAMKNMLMASIERPSFGAWLGILRQASDNAGKHDENSLIGKIQAYFGNHLEPALQGESEKSSKKSVGIDRAILKMRNHLAHAGRLADGESEKLLEAHQERFEQEVVLAAAFWKEYPLVIGGNGECLLAQGLPDKKGAFKPYDGDVPAIEPGHAFLLHDGAPLLDLYPFHAFLEVIQARDDEDVKLGAEAPQLYCRMSDGPVVEFTVLHDAYSFAQQRERILADWEKILPLDEWREAREASGAVNNWEERFRSLKGGLTDVFVGRDDEIDQLKGLVKSNEHRVLWVTGKAGMGKSAVMARMMEVANNWRDAFVTIPYFFRAGHSYCTKHDFLRASLDCLGEALGRYIAEPADVTEVERVFIDALREVASGSRRVLFILDGLDEIERISPGFLGVLRNARDVEGVTWLCAGRPEAEIEEAMRELGAHFVFGKDGLSPLTTDAIRAILDYDLGPKKYELFEKDKLEDGSYANEWIDTIAERSEGLPIYVRLLTKDIARGKRRLEDIEIKKLPKGLEAYYEDTLARLRVSSVGAALTSIFSLLAQAREPLDETLLHRFLTDFKPNLRERDRSAWEEGIRRALDHGSMMMVRDSTPEGRPGWRLYHESFREQLLRSETVKEDREEARFSMLKWCSTWRENEDVRPYALRHYAIHLQEAGRSEELFALVRDKDFVEQQKRLDVNLPAETLLRVLQYAARELDGQARNDAVAEFAIRRAGLLDDLRQESAFDAMRRGDLQRAMDLADLHDKEGRSARLLLCAWELVREGKVQEAEQMLVHLFERGPYTLDIKIFPIPVGRIMRRLLRHFDADFLRIKQCVDERKIFLARMALSLAKNADEGARFALELVSKTEESWYRSQGLLFIAESLDLHDWKKERELYGQALAAALEIKDSDDRSEALLSIAKSLSFASPHVKPLLRLVEEAQGIKDPRRLADLSRIAMRVSSYGFHDAAELIDREIKESREVAGSCGLSAIANSLSMIESDRGHVGKLFWEGVVEPFLRITEPNGRSKARSIITERLSSIDPDQLELLFNVVSREGSGINDSQVHATGLAIIAQCLRSIGSDRGKNLLEELFFYIARDIEDVNWRFFAQSAIAVNLLSIDPKHAKPLFGDVIDYALNYDEETLVSSIVEGMSWGDPNLVGRLFKHLLKKVRGKGPKYRIAALLPFAQQLSSINPKRAGALFEEAVEAAREIEHLGDSSRALTTISEKLVSVDPERACALFEEAIEIAGRIKNIEWRYGVLSSISKALASFELDRFSRLFEKIFYVSQGTADYSFRSEILSSIAENLSSSDLDRVDKLFEEFGEALKVAREYRCLLTDSIPSIAKGLTSLASVDPERAGALFEEAVEAALGIEDSGDRSRALASITEGVASLASADPERACALFE